MLRSFQQFLGLSRRSQPLPPRLHLPCCGGGSVVLAARLVGFFFFFSAAILTWGAVFPTLRTAGHGWTTLYAWP